MPVLLEQSSIGEGVEKWTVGVKAAGPFVARQRARAYARRQDATIRNFIRPEVKGKGNGDQTTFEQIIPDTIQRDKFAVEMVVFR